MTLATNTLINTSYGIKMEEAIQTAAEELGYSNLRVKQKEAIMHYLQGKQRNGPSEEQLFEGTTPARPSLVASTLNNSRTVQDDVLYNLLLLFADGKLTKQRQHFIVTRR